MECRVKSSINVESLQIISIERVKIFDERHWTIFFYLTLINNVLQNICNGAIYVILL